jgi:hypothetical protein
MVPADTDELARECGGSLIFSKWIVTSASCAYQYAISAILSSLQLVCNLFYFISNLIVLEHAKVVM